MNGYFVKNVKTMKGGMEGNFMTCSLYRDAVKVALVNDDASGGELRIDWVSHHEEKLIFDLCASLPDHEYKYGDEKVSIPMSPDLLIGLLVDRYLGDKRLKCLCAGGKICYRTVEMQKQADDGEWKQIQSARPYTPAVRDALMKKYPGVEILNDRFVDWIPKPSEEDTGASTAIFAP